MEIISKKEAVLLNLKYYFTGIPCIRGHISKRRTSHNDCVECRNKHFRIKDKVNGNKSKWDKNYITNNPEKRSEKRKKQKLQRTHCVPEWYSELDSLVFEEAYKLCKIRNLETNIKWNIDHMIPINAKTVSGLHCAENIQVIPKIMNLHKSNKLIYINRMDWLK